MALGVSKRTNLRGRRSPDGGYGVSAELEGKGQDVQEDSSAASAA